jgi:hypothetical protein
MPGTFSNEDAACEYLQRHPERVVRYIAANLSQAAINALESHMKTAERKQELLHGALELVRRAGYSAGDAEYDTISGAITAGGGK